MQTIQSDQYTGRRVRLSGWVKALSGLLFDKANTFSLDFHPIPHRGESAGLETHYIPLAGKAYRLQPKRELLRRTQHVKAAATFACFRQADDPDSRPREPARLLRDASRVPGRPYFHYVIGR